MRIVKTKKFLLVAALIVAAVTTLAALASQNHKSSVSDKQKGTEAKQEANNYFGPAVDYDANHKATALASRDNHILREARGRRYNREAPQPLGELPPDWEDFSIHTHWQVGLSGLPATKSNVVILGQVVDAQAFLSNDKTAVYSEFTIQIEEILKDSPTVPLTSNSLIAEREGGVVRFKDGRLLRFTIDDQGMPRIGRQYIFFLNRNEQGEDFHILTVYELRHGKVTPLDTGQQFTNYRGFDKTEFLNKVRETILSASQPSREKEEEKQ